MTRIHKVTGLHYFPEQKITLIDCITHLIIIRVIQSKLRCNLVKVIKRQATIQYKFVCFK